MAVQLLRSYLTVGSRFNRQRPDGLLVSDVAVTIVAAWHPQLGGMDHLDPLAAPAGSMDHLDPHAGLPAFILVTNPGQLQI